MVWNTRKVFVSQWDGLGRLVRGHKNNENATLCFSSFCRAVVSYEERKQHVCWQHVLLKIAKDVLCCVVLHCDVL